MSGTTRNARLPQPSLLKKKPECMTGFLSGVTRLSFGGPGCLASDPHNSWASSGPLG
jgi:hypothetical protein